MEGPHGKYHTAIRLARNQGSERGNATTIRLETDLGKGAVGHALSNFWNHMQAGDVSA